MEIRPVTPKKALNKAFLKVKPIRSEIEHFKLNLTRLLDSINESESEEHHKNLLSDFLKDTYYKQIRYINTKGRNDLVIHNGEKASDTVGVIMEAKKPSNKTEMLRVPEKGDTPEEQLAKINVKAFHELVLYYLRERITQKNIEIKYVIATNIYEWFIFDAVLFDRLFAQNKHFVQQFTDFEEGRMADTKTDFFYKQIAEPFIADLKPDLEFTWFNIRDYEKTLRNADKKDDNLLIALFKLLSPEHLLKLPFANDSNSLDKRFYGELLHIIGLTETKEGSKKLIERSKEGQRHSGSLLENAIIQLESLDKISRLENPGQYGANMQERLFNVGLELSITWVNRILFLKLLEAQLLTYHNSSRTGGKGDPSYEFLSLEKIKDYDDLNSLFFQVLARKHDERNEDVKEAFSKVPYLNSSLFEPTEIEHSTIFISNLRNDKPVPMYAQSVLKDKTGKKRSGTMNPLEYLFDFLNAYDFASEGSEDIQEDNKTLINASVLGLIFEKINGYKDGSFFTPGFITMYMCRETIRKAVVQKFDHDFPDLRIGMIKDIYEFIPSKISRQQANEIINSLKICDPAVGSGHFLVSALNELIAIKNELKILEDKNGKSLNRYEIEVVNDELIVTDEDGELFEYNPGNKENRRIQETLFHEKQSIIENCLFGVDINPNSVKICRLRLWIELLKNAYYMDSDTVEIGHALSLQELQTLPNIDINIKSGNSLISRFSLDADLKQALKKSGGKWTIDSYRIAVDTYRNAQNKEQKREMECLINDIKSNFRSEISKNDPKLKRLNILNGELFVHTNQQQMFELSAKEKAEWNKKLEKLTGEIRKLEAEIEEIKNNKIYENAFEWRFEFPEVLDDNGDFVGFDVVIGNPPYIRQEEFSEIKSYLKSRYKIYHSIADLLTYFVELSHDILKQNGTFMFIISNKFTRANYGQVMRLYLLENTDISHFIDFSGIPVFDEATVDAAILGFQKQKTIGNSLLYANLLKEEIDVINFENYIQKIKQNFAQQNLTTEVWAFENSQVLKIKQKVESQGVPLKDWDITINYGIKTGFNEAFVIDGKKKDELNSEDSNNAKLLKPLLRGRDIQKWQADFQDLWLIATFPSKKYNINEFPFIEEYLKTFGKKIEQTGEKGARKKTTNKWFETQDNISYWYDFTKPKIIYPNMTKFLPFVIDLEGKYYHNDKSFHLVSDRIYWLGAFLNSKLFDYCFRDNFPELLGGTRELRKVFFDKISVKQISEDAEKPFKKLVCKILELKKTESSTDTTNLEAQIDQLVYQLYGLTDEEIKIIENGVK